MLGVARVERSWYFTAKDCPGFIDDDCFWRQLKLDSWERDVVGKDDMDGEENVDESGACSVTPLLNRQLVCSL